MIITIAIDDSRSRSQVIVCRRWQQPAVKSLSTRGSQQQGSSTFFFSYLVDWFSCNKRVVCSLINHIQLPASAVVLLCYFIGLIWSVLIGRYKIDSDPKFLLHVNDFTKPKFVQPLKLTLTGNCWEEKMADASMEKKVAEMSLDQQKAWLWAFSSASMFSKAYMNISRSIKACLFAARDFSHYRICCYRRMVCEYIFWYLPLPLLTN